jgi:hypothetical protein
LTDAVNSVRISRRNILVGLGAGAIGAASGAASAAVAASPLTAGSARGEMAAWASRVGEHFAVAGGGTLRLSAVEPLCSGGPMPGGRRCFAAIFEAAGGRIPDGDATYALASASVPATPLYLGARDDRRGRSRFVAAFN